ncbi:arginine N-succinyltransferase [Algimonas porphyrae]|uniref:Arginine N-succinyltransferase n=1 Tax=Algimonas porphyrae TaxID=1128113 RepID=A0ABQ5UYT5_9PROT|nr:arginine N-succinyltransferase [Algimonas porphyrae]GLQ20464.1 arginine N-succinyltransferase [Algimonas porphyrae]
MDIFRLATSDDAEAIARFTSTADAGLTTVPRSQARVDDYIAATHRFLAGDSQANRLLFVVERDGQVMGISGIIPRLGIERPFYSFKRSRHARRASQINLRTDYETLQLTTDFDGYTELASIFLAPEARGKGVARLLSLGRLCFIENHQELFAMRLMADIRGWVDDQGNSPFWDHLTSKFIQTDFDIADRLSASDGRFIVQLLPSLPILMNLLPDAARICAGRPHEISRGAMNLLMGAGFEDTELCDIFDGGPAIQCRIGATLIARTVRDMTGYGDGLQRLLAFTGQGADFRATLTTGDLAAGTLNAAAEPLGSARIALAQDRRG